MTQAPYKSVVSTSETLQKFERRVPRQGLLVFERPVYIYSEHGALLTAAVKRAVGREDLEYLEGLPFQSRGLQRYAQACRKRFLEAYLEERRKSFFTSARVAREFAADSDAPELAFAVLRQSIRFRLLSAALRLSLRFHLIGPAWRLTESLVLAMRPDDSSVQTPAVQPGRS